jgi:4-amino-4-deoxy-L-arabinose transferase-like glycosyltransferase
MSTLVAVYVAIGAGILAYMLSDEWVRSEVAEMEWWRKLAYTALALFLWPLIVCEGEE